MRSLLVWCGIGAAAFANEIPLPPDPEEAAYPAIGRFVEVLEAVRQRHPDVDRLAYERLVNHALEGMLAGLDPHSSFIHPEMAARMKASPELDPGIASLGITFGLRDDGPYIATVAPAGPADKAGVIPGSAVIQIDSKPLAGVDFPQMIESLRRPAGSLTKLRLKSPATPQEEDIALTHRVVEERSVAEVRIMDKESGVGYLRLAVFGPGCAGELEAALDELEDAGMKSLVLDLRGNGGGDLGETVKILGLWLPPETAVVSTRGRDAAAVEILKTPDRQRRKRGYPITVMIDRMSASASELTAGALRDLKRAKIVGEKSYGKGSVQNIIPMGGGAALRLTIATYHTPSGNTPHLKGITPDVEVAISDADRENLAHRFRIDSLTPDQRAGIEAWKDPVIAAALQTLAEPEKPAP